MHFKLLFFLTLAFNFVWATDTNKKNSEDEHPLVDILEGILRFPGAVITAGIETGVAVGGHAFTSVGHFLRNLSTRTWNILSEKASLIGDGAKRVIDFGKNSMSEAIKFINKVSENLTGKTIIRKIIIDTDAGGDDAVAIFLALAAPEVEVIAITCSYGNTIESNVETNVLKILTIANKPNIKVYPGAKEPLKEPYEPGEYFGKDGLGDIDFDRNVTGKIDRSKNASDVMVELAKQFPGEVSLVTLGPTTNVAAAMKMDPNFSRNIDRIYVMGTWINNTDPDKNEFNWSLDPESNEILLNSTKDLKSLIVPKDVCLKQPIDKSWRIKELGAIKSDKMNFLNKVEDKLINNNPEEPWSCSDQLTVALMIWPELVTSQVKGHMTAILENPSRGKVIFQPNQNNSNVEVVLEFDITGFKEKLINYMV